MRARPLFLLPILALACSGENAVSTPARTPPAEASRAAPPVVAIDWERQPVVLAVAGDGSEGAPVSLTAGDGAGLQIVSLSARAVVQDPIAFTELHFVFKNPEPRDIEGRFEITLPPNAAVSRFAMRQRDGWQEGEVVELEAAREAYEDFLHRRIDPALLEKQAGNRFQARVFPIPASGEKEIIFSYSQELVRARDPYRLYLRGLPELGRLDLRILYDKPDPGAAGSVVRQAFELHKTRFTPDRDLTLPLPPPGEALRGLRHEELVMARITPVREAPPDRIGSLLVLFDTSASRALGFRGQVERLGKVIEAIRKDAGAAMPLSVVAFDQDAEVVYSGVAGDFGPKDLGTILGRKPLGASNIGKALRFAAKVKAPGGGRFTRALLVTDGIPTVGDVEAQPLRASLAELQRAGVERLDALIDGGIRDEGLLGELAQGGLPRAGAVVEATLPPERIAERLAGATVSGIKVNVPGSAWSWPSELSGVQPGDQAIVYAAVPKGAPFEVEIAKGDAKQKLAVRLTSVERPLLERAAVNAQIRRLMAERGSLADSRVRELKRQQIIQLSTRYRVLSDFTGLLVLDSDEDYARFKIDRRALADIIEVGPAGIDLLNRTARAAPKAVAGGQVPEPPTPDSESSKKGEAPREAKKDKASAAAPVAPPPPPPSAAAPSSEPLNIEPRRPGAVMPAAPAGAARPAPSAPPRVAAKPAMSPPPSAGAGRPVPELMKEEPPEEQPEETPSRAGGAPRSWSTPPVPMVEAGPQVPPQDADEGPHMPPYEGRFRDVMDRLSAKKTKEALDIASQWQEAEPGDALALIALGECYEALGRKDAAARAYGSIIDLFPSRADLRRYAGARLERLGALAQELALDTFQKAAAQRPDHPASHRLLAYALVRSGRMEEAFEAIAGGLRRTYPEGRFEGVPWILLDDVGLIAAAWIRAQPAKRAAITARLREFGAKLPTRPSLRFVLTWETDANDVDFHIRDGRRGHAFYGYPALRSGGELFADVQTGYGPECFAIDGRPQAYPYKLAAHYYSRGPMGYGMGKLEVIEHDGKGGLRFDERPFVVMTDQAYVDLGVVAGPLK